MNADNNELRADAYNGIATFYKFLQQTQKDKAIKAIKLWRNPSKPTSDMMVSFNLVSPDQEERNNLLQYLDNLIEKFVALNAVVTTNSAPLQSATSIIEKINYTSFALESSNKERILLKINDILNENKDVLFKESNDLYGFFDFGGNFVDEISYFISSLHRGEIKDDVIKVIITSLQEYLRHNFAVLEAIVKLNSLMAKPLWGKTEIVCSIKSRIFSNNYRVRNDALNAMIIRENAPSFKELVNEMIKRIEIGTNESISNVLTTLCSLYYHNLIGEANLRKLPDALEALYHEIKTFPISETIRSDIYYFVLEFVGALSAEDPKGNFGKIISLWESYANSPETFNDVRIGFEIGYERAFGNQII